MAAIGMKHLVGAPWAAQQTEGQLPKYGTGMKIGRAISSNITFQRNESELYADDVLAESDDTMTGGSIDMTVAEILDEVGAVIFGAKTDADGAYHDSDLAKDCIRTCLQECRGFARSRRLFASLAHMGVFRKQKNSRGVAAYRTSSKIGRQPPYGRICHTVAVQT